MLRIALGRTGRRFLHWARRLITAVAALILMCLAAVAGAEPAAAELRYVRDYSMAYTLNRDGSVKVELELIGSFSYRQSHGILITIPVQVETSDPKVDRSYPLSDVAVSSPSGAPAEFSQKTKYGVTTLKIGSADVSIHGSHQYRVTYTQHGVINKADGHEEFYWNVAQDWSVQIYRATAVVHAPQKPDKVTCYAGETGGTAPCTEKSISPAKGAQPAQAVFSQEKVTAGDAFTIVAAYPEGTFPDAPVLTADPAIRTSWSFDWSDPWVVPTLAGLGILVVSVGLGMLALGRRKGPKTTDFVQRANADAHPDLNLSHQVMPYLVGYLWNGQFGPQDLSAMLVGLHERELVEIEPYGDPTEGAWSLSTVATHAHAPLAAAERVFLETLFARKGTVVVGTGSSPRLQKAWTRTCAVLRRDPEASSWLYGPVRYRKFLWPVAGILFFLGLISITILVALGSWLWPISVGAMLGGAAMWIFLVAGKLRYSPAGEAAVLRLASLKAALVAICGGRLDVPSGHKAYTAYAVAVGYGENWATRVKYRYPRGLGEAKTGSANEKPVFEHWWVFLATGESTVGSAGMPSSGSSDSSGASGDSGFSDSGSSGGGGGGTGGGGW